MLFEKSLECFSVLKLIILSRFRPKERKLKFCRYCCWIIIQIVDFILHILSIQNSNIVLDVPIIFLFGKFYYLSSYNCNEMNCKNRNGIRVLQQLWTMSIHELQSASLLSKHYCCQCSLRLRILFAVALTGILSLKITLSYGSCSGRRYNFSGNSALNWVLLPVL